MTERHEFRDAAFARGGQFAYLPDRDRYLLAHEPPRHRLNVIGAGINGQEHMRVALLEGRATIHGVYDPNPGSVAAARRITARAQPPGELTVYDSLAAACADPAADGLIIATPNFTHLDVLRVAVRSGKPVLLEKPMATTIPDALAIVRLAEEYPAALQVGLQYRYKPAVVEAIHEALVRGSLGALKTISILEHRMPFLDKVGQWNKFARFSGGTLVEKCCHYFDLFTLFARSRPASVYATGSMAVNFTGFEYEGERADILDNAFAIVTYENGIRANFNLCMFAPMFSEELILCGDRGRLKATEHQDFQPAGAPRAQVELRCTDDRLSRTTTPSYPRFIEESGHSGGTYIEHVRFMDAIEGRPTDAAAAAEGFWSVVVGVAAEESVRTGAVVRIDDLLARHGLDAESEPAFRPYTPAEGR